MSRAGKHYIYRYSIGRQWLHLFLILSPILPAQKIDFEHLTLKQGLSQGSVTCVVQDSIGFIWFGTYDGLNRYDGSNIRIYRKDSENPNSLSFNFVRTLLVDPFEGLWIGTAGGGLNIFNPKKECFIHYQNDLDNPFSISHNQIYTLYQDRSGGIWIGTWGGGLNLVIKPAGNKPSVFTDSLKFVHYRHDPDDPKSIAHDKISAISEDPQGYLWIGTRAGLSVFDPQKEEVIWQYRHNPDDNNSLSGDNITSVLVDRKGFIWVGTWGNGLNKLDPKSKRVTRYVHDPDNPKSIAHNTIMSLFQDKSGDLWIGTWGGGISRLLSTEKNDHFIRYQHRSNDPLSVAGNSIYDIFEDRTGVLWIGTDWNGLSKYNKDRNQFPHYQYDPNAPDKLNDNIIISLFKDSRGILWIGTRNGGLNAYHQKTNQYEHYMHDPSNPSSISHNTVRTIQEDDSGTLWVGTEMGLNRFDRDKKIFYRYHSDTEDIANNNIVTLFQDHEGYLWIGNWGNGLYKFNPALNIFVDYPYLSDDSTSLKNQIIWCVTEDKHRRLWVGTDQHGLYRLNPNDTHFIHYTHDKKNTNSVCDNKILSLFCSANGDLWIGTTTGLNRIAYNENPNAPLVFDHYTVNEGLYSNTIHGINEDNQGNLWICNGEHLVVFNPETKVIRGYHTEDRLQAGEFSINAISKDSDTGTMYVGSVNGFNSYHPDSIHQNITIPNVVITNFKIFNNPVSPGQTLNGRIILENSITETRKLILSYKDNVLTFEFAALHYNSPENNQYAFKMEGFEKAWNDGRNTQHMATYTNLNPGQYTFLVKASNNDGFWNENGAALNIYIRPPFWLTWWFRLLMIFLLGLSVYGMVEYRTYGMKKQRKILERQVQERTHDLEVANNELEAQKRQIETHANALKRSNEDLEQFAYAASHDLQEPLRMISAYAGLLERKLHEQMDKEGKEFFFYMIDGAKRMQILIHDLLFYSRVTSQTKPFEKTDLNEILDHVLINLKMVIHECEASVTHDSLPSVMCDTVQYERLFQNLIGNSIKYCNKKPEIHISAKLKNDTWIISIKDNGIGIDPKFKKKIFGVFQRLHHLNEYSGTGIGLAVCKKIVERHGGEIWMESEGEGHGSTFYFTIKS
ncbi:GHKL domain-containing protein [bacterium]|nr:GHKL domain-containing protein [bacterium]